MLKPREIAYCAVFGAAAMAVRGYGIETVAPNERVQLTMADAIAVLCAATAFAVSVLMRMGVVG
jgi:hypothetical protein